MMRGKEMDSKTLSIFFVNQAKSKHPMDEIGYAYAFGYLSGTLEEVLRLLTPEQRESLAKKWGLI